MVLENERGELYIFDFKTSQSFSKYREIIEQNLSIQLELYRTALEKEKQRDRQAREADKQEKARIAAVEKEIADLEAKIAELEAQSAQPEVYSNSEKAKENALALRKAREALEEKYDRWAELSE